ncbi:MAG: GNAT family N-acetyltransferase [Saprospiraceae bacterium]|nr:GNAT family N-acetyltransferase [Saprospiraceae bacterium]
MTDRKEIFMLRSDPEINQYLGRSLCTSIGDAEAFIQKIISSNLVSYYWVITHPPSDTLVGTICLFDVNNNKGSCEIGFELIPGFQGKGIMTEALKAVIDFAFQHLGISSITAAVHQDNHRSRSLLDRFEFSPTQDQTDLDPGMILLMLTHDNINLIKY